MVVKEERLGTPERTMLRYEVPISLVRRIFLSLEEILEENAPPAFQMLGRSVGRALGATSLDEIPEVLERHKWG